MTFNRAVTVLIFTLSFCAFVKSHENRDAQSYGKRSQLKMTFFIYRHGARAPIQLIPNNTYNSKWEQIGLGELTNIGKEQQDENGEIIRNEYNNFIGPLYNFNEFYIQSTNVSRAVMSGQAFTTGLFPPSGHQVWKNDCLGRNWQPIPVFTSYPVNCPKDPTGTLIYQLITQAGNDKDIIHRNQEILNAISIVTGASMSNGFFYSDALICSIYQKIDLPSVITKIKNYEAKIFAFSDDIFNYIMKTYYPLLAPGLLNDMIQKIELYNAKKSTIRTYVYSLHDSHVAAFMAAVYAYVGEPEFCGTAYLELYGPDEKSKTDYIKIRYRRKLTTEAKYVDIKTCGYNCPYDKFLKLVNDVNKLSDRS